MGCFNVSCAVSHITIHEGDRTFLFPLLPNINEYNYFLNKRRDDGTVTIGPASLYLYQDEHFIPFCFPIEGTYNDYGALENIVHNENTEAIETFLGITIEEFIELITENRGKDVYDQYDSFYDVFFTKKELMDDTVCFEDFLIGMGFKKNLDEYESPDCSYFVQKIATQKETVYDIIGKDGCIKRLSDSRKLKKNLLEFHKTLTGQYLGIENPNIIIMEKLSAMFVHGDIYDFLTKPGNSIKSNPENIYLSNYLLFQLGFSYHIEGGYYEKNGVIVHLDFKMQLKKDDITINVYNYKEFIQAYKKLTGINCKAPNHVMNMDNEEFRYEDMLIQYQKTSELHEKMAEYIPIQDDYWKNSIKGLYLFRDWKYFFPMYEKLLLERKIKTEYVNYVRFCLNSYSVNTMFMPTFQGPQCGNIEMERDLLKVALNIVERKIEDWYD